MEFRGQNQLQKIHIQDYEHNPDMYWIEEFKPTEGASAPFYDSQEFNGAEMFNANARRSMLRYGEETRTHLEVGGSFEAPPNVVVTIASHF